MAAKRKSKAKKDAGGAYTGSATSNGNAQQPEPAPPTQPPGSNGNGEATPNPGNGNGHALPVPTSRPRSREEITAEETAGHLALRILAAKISEQVLSGMSALFDELIQEKSHLLDDDDEEQDEGWIDNRRERERELLDEGITDALEQHPDFGTINDLPTHSDPDVARDAEQLKKVLAQYPYIGAVEFEEKFSREQFQRMVRRDIKERFRRDVKYREHVADDVPGSDIKHYGSRGRTSSRGTFAKADDFEHGGGLDALFTGGWMRVAKDRSDPFAWSHEYGRERKTHHKNWRQVFRITEKDGHVSVLEVPREKLAGNGAAAIRLLMKAGVHVINRDRAVKALVRFLRFKPKREIVRMPRAGWAEIGSSWVFVRPEEVITPPGMPSAKNTTYVLESATTQHGLHVLGTVEGWMSEVAAAYRGNSNVALAFATFFAAPVLCLASEPGGGNHLYGKSTIGKTMVSALGQSIYGWPHETADDAFGVSWGGTEAGLDAIAQARTDLGLPLDEITLSDPRTAEQVVYKVASGTQGPRAISTGQPRETAHASVLVLSTGEKSLAGFIGKNLQEGARKRLVDVPAEVQPGSAFETIPPAQLHTESKRLFDAMKRQHGAVGRAWQQQLVSGLVEIKMQFDAARKAFLNLPEVAAVVDKAHPSVRAVVNRFALYAAALRMAIAADLLPWTVAEADAGIVACMNRWVKQRGNVDTAGELLRAAREMITSIKAALPDRFVHIRKAAKGGWSPATDADKVKQKTPDAFDGYVKGDRVLIRPEAWRRLCNGFDPTEIARLFQRQGVLITDDSGGKLSRSEQVIGKVERFYVLSLTPLTP